jgi:sugar O-acyltransferase (sialic acid O-acetyltransferase NeuD family)
MNDPLSSHKKNNLILIGGGGHCKSCIDVIEKENKYIIKGIIDTKEKIGQHLLGYKYIGTDDDINQLVKAGYSFLISIGQIKSASTRKRLYEKLKSVNAHLPTIISPHAIVSKHATIGEGTIVMHSVNINADAKISNNCIINTGCNIEHDVEIGENSHISTHAIINGNCEIGKEVFVGSGTIISNGIQINSSVVIGAGSVVIKSINEIGTFAGNPLRIIKNG